jgi:hypothetical chaperone protein
MQAIGIDFGTTNTVLAFPGPDGRARVQTFTRNGEAFEAVRTALSFRKNDTRGGAPLAEAGPWAIQDFIDLPEETRFLQSFKSFAASPAFTDTAIFTMRYQFENLLSAFMNKVQQHAGFERFPPKVVVGRPVTFAGNNPDDALAHRRYDAAFKGLGLEHVHYVLEPVAAAHFYAQQLTRDAIILVGDFGGGTSDFSILRFHFSGNGMRADALGHAGLGIAGDTFDYRIIDNVVSPRLGKQATYKSWGKILPVPVHYFSSFSRWNELCLMQRPEVIRDLKELVRNSSEGDKLQSLIDLIEGGVSYDLYRTVSRVKAKLSQSEVATFAFRSSGVSIETEIQRSDFENWIAEDLEKIGRRVDDALASAGLAAKDIDRVFLTGGTSYVPAVRRLFERRFPQERIDIGEQLLSIAKGLALIGTSGEIEKWSINS